MMEVPIAVVSFLAGLLAGDRLAVRECRREIKLAQEHIQKCEEQIQQAVTERKRILGENPE